MALRLHVQRSACYEVGHNVISGVETFWVDIFLSFEGHGSEVVFVALLVVIAPN